MDKVSIDKIVPEDFPSQGLNCDMFTPEEERPYNKNIKNDIFGSLVPTNIVLPNLLSGKYVIHGVLDHEAQARSVSMLYVPSDMRLDLSTEEFSNEVVLGLVTYSTAFNREFSEDLFTDKFNIYRLVAEAGNRCLSGIGIDVNVPSYETNKDGKIYYLALTFKEDVLPDSLRSKIDITKLYGIFLLANLELAQKNGMKKRSWFRR